MSDESTNRFSSVIKLQFNVFPLEEVKWTQKPIVNTTKPFNGCFFFFKYVVDNVIKARQKSKLQNGTSCHCEWILHSRTLRGQDCRVEVAVGRFPVRLTFPLRILNTVKWAWRLLSCQIHSRRLWRWLGRCRNLAMTAKHDRQRQTCVRLIFFFFFSNWIENINVP